MIGFKLFVLSTIARIFVLYRCAKEIENFEQQVNLLRDVHQNLIITSLY